MRSSSSLLVISFVSMILWSASVGCTGDAKSPAVAADTTGLTLPAGFQASIVADTIGHIRHLAVNEQGDLYVKLAELKDGKGIWFLRDTDHDGNFDQRTGFGDFPGTGILTTKNALFASSNSGVFKYALNEKGEVIDTANPQTIVKGLADHKADNSKSIAMDDQGNLYVTVGSWNEGCTNPDTSVVGWPGCPLLDSVGGVWQFKSDMTDQTYAQSVHYTKGLKNIVGLAWNSANKTLYGTNHGRGRLWEKFPQYYTKEQNLDLPAETLYELKPGSDGGWPFVYYDQNQKKQMLSPEYGGDGKKTVEGKYMDPVVAFPGHLAPNDLMFYTGNMFPERYKNGAFLVFHARSIPQKKGYLVAFVPFKDGKPSGPWEIFAEGFPGIDLETSKEPMKHRPMGIAQAPDGSIYVADDLRGTVYRISYKK